MLHEIAVLEAEGAGVEDRRTSSVHDVLDVLQDCGPRPVATSAFFVGCARVIFVRQSARLGVDDLPEVRPEQLRNQQTISIQVGVWVFTHPTNGSPRCLRQAENIARAIGVSTSQEVVVQSAPRPPDDRRSDLTAEPPRPRPSALWHSLLYRKRNPTFRTGSVTHVCQKDTRFGRNRLRFGCRCLVPKVVPVRTNERMVAQGRPKAEVQEVRPNYHISIRDQHASAGSTSNTNVLCRPLEELPSRFLRDTLMEIVRHLDDPKCGVLEWRQDTSKRPVRDDVPINDDDLEDALPRRGPRRGVQ